MRPAVIRKSLEIALKRPYFIDTDTASDDAVALMIAFASNDIEIAGIGIVAGNVPLEQGVQNALFVRQLCAARAPVFAGAAKPLSRPLETAQFVHGQDGMADIGLPLAGREADEGHAVTALISAAGKHRGNLELVTLGPLTNIALAISLAPQIAGQIKRCVIMGGAGDGVGNITPVSEFNIWADPEAAKIVFESAIPKLMVGWDMSRKFATISDQQASEIRAIGSEKAAIAMDTQATVREFCMNTTGIDGFDLPDPLAMAAAIEPNLITRSSAAAVSIVTDDGETRGMTLIDERGYHEQSKSCLVCRAVDRNLFTTMLRDSLR